MVTLANSAFTGFTDCMDIDDTATFNGSGVFSDADGASGPAFDTFVPSLDGATLRQVDFPGSLLSCGTNFEADSGDADGSKATLAFTSSTGTTQVPFNLTTLLTNPFVGVDGGQTTRFTPAAGSALRSGVVAFTDPYAASGAFFETVAYRGAVDPAADWTVGWADFPAN
jgi:hypothetical protein